MKLVLVAGVVVCGWVLDASAMQSRVQYPVACTTPINGGAASCVPVEMRNFGGDSSSRLPDPPQPEQGQLMLRFQLIEASSARSGARDPAIASVDSVLRDLFRYSTYQLLSEAVVASTTTNGGRSTLLLSGGGGRGETYQLDVTIYVQNQNRSVGGRDAAVGPPPIQISVTLKEVPPSRAEPNPGGSGQQDVGGQTGAKAATGANTSPRPIAPPRTVLETSVTMSPGHTVVLGSTQPGGPSPDRTLILVMRPEVRKY